MKGRGSGKTRARRRVTWCKVGMGWSRTTPLRLRMQLGERMAMEPVLVALPQGVAVETVHWMRLVFPHLGVEIAVVGRRVFWRRVAIALRTPKALRDGWATWEKGLAGFRVRLSEPQARGSQAPERLEAVLVRALVMEVVGQRRSGRTAKP